MKRFIKRLLKQKFPDLFNDETIKLPKPLQRDLSDYENRLYEIVLGSSQYPIELQNRWVSDVSVFVTPQTMPLEEQIAVGLAERKNAQVRLDRPQSEKEEQAKAFLQPSYNEAVLAINEKYDRMNLFPKALQSELIKAKARLQKMEQEMKVIPEKPTFWDSSKVAILIGVVLAACEAGFSFDAIDSIGLPWAILSYGIAAIIGGIVAVCTHLTGLNLASKKPFRAIAAFFAGSGAVFLIIYLRAFAPVEDEFNHSILSVANIALYIIGLVISERATRYHYYFATKYRVENLPSEIDEMYKQCDLRDIELAGKKKEFKATIKQDVIEHDNNLRDTITRLDVVIVRANANLKAIMDRVKLWEKQGIEALKVIFRNAQNDSQYLK